MAAPKAHRKIRLKKNLRRSILRGHPWVFDKAVGSSEGCVPGEVVTVVDDKGPLATAFVDPGSPIRLRILATRANEKIGSQWLHNKLVSAARRRLSEPSLASSNALRLVHGEGDGIPGLVIDCYAGHAIALLDGEAAEALWAPKADIIRRALEIAGVEIETLSMRRVGRERRWLRDAPPPPSVQVYEGEAQFLVDLRRGQKTGLFLDQRANRQLVGSRSAGLEVLNLFGYNGGFSLAAALGGASKTVTVDIAEPAIQSAQMNFELSGLDPSQHEFVAEDVFSFLERCVAQDRHFDLVICDPPSFASSEKALKQGLKAYKRVNEMALSRVNRGGIFCSASCSSHITSVHMLEILADASRGAKRELVVVDERGAAADHPVRPSFPEGRYLNFMLCSVD